MLISIITISYNQKFDLDQTLSSVHSQVFTNFEHIIIDGGSTDGSKILLESNNDSLSYWVSEPDKGIYNAMNKGIAKAKGDYLFFLNGGDDFVNTYALKNIAKYLLGEEVIYFNINIVNERNESKLKRIPSELSFSYLHNDLPPHQSTFFHRTLFEKYGKYDENLKIVSDWKFLILALIKHNVSYKHVNEAYTNFYLGGISNNSLSEGIIKKERQVVLQEEFPILLNDLKYKFKLERIIRNLKKSRKIQLLVKLGIIDKF